MVILHETHLVIVVGVDEQRLVLIERRRPSAGHGHHGVEVGLYPAVLVLPPPGGRLSGLGEGRHLATQLLTLHAQVVNQSLNTLQLCLQRTDLPQGDIRQVTGQVKSGQWSVHVGHKSLVSRSLVGHDALCRAKEK